MLKFENNIAQTPSAKLNYPFGRLNLFKDLRNCHNTWVVRDTENIVTTFDISQSVTAPYNKNVKLRKSYI